MRVSENEDLGPLPQAGRNRELQVLSIKALNAILPDDKFIVRDERIEDYGVDLSLEVLIQGCATNLRAQVQMKGTDQGGVNDDGSYSLSVEVKNLNYLLNGPSPLYVVYIAPRNELRFVWAREKLRDLFQNNPDWKAQATVTLRFDSFLTSEAIEEIHGRIRREAQMHRKIHDLLAQASVTENVVIGINPQNLFVSNPQELNALLLEAGMTMISSGHASQVLEAIRHLNPQDAYAPRIEAVCAYAHYAQGRYDMALGHLSNALLRRDELTTDDQRFADFLRLVCEYQSGRITLDEYSQRQHLLDNNADGAYELAHWLDTLRHKLLNEPDPLRCTEIADQVRAAAGEILSRAGISRAFQLQARLVLLYIEGGEISRYASREICRLSVRQKLGQGFNLQATLQSVNTRMKNWHQSMNDVLEEAVKQENAILLADAYDTRAVIHFAFLSGTHLTTMALGAPADLPPQSVIENIREDARKAMLLYAQVGRLEGELRAKLLQADCHDLAGQSAAARQLATEVLPQAQAMSYKTLAVRAQQHLTGQSLYKHYEADLQQKQMKDEEYLVADLDDEGIRNHAISAMGLFGLSSDHLPYLEKEVRALQGIARASALVSSY